MNRKILSLVLCLTLLFTTVFAGFTVASAEEATADTENLIKNGNFESYEGTTPANWIVRTGSGVTAEIVEDVAIAEGVTSNAFKLTTTEALNGEANRSYFVYDGVVDIEKNAKYTVTYWVKVKNNTGLRAYMFEPNYIDKDGNPRTNKMAQEGGNIYTYGYDAGLGADGKPITRVIRKDITHTFKIAETGNKIDATGASMFISRSGGVEQPLTPDYPSTERQGEWLQIIHTFETGNSEAHEAEVAYQFSIPSAVDGEVWIADMQMSVERSYVPLFNDDTLGTVAEGNRIPVEMGQEITLTAEPFGENVFDGWYVGDELVSEEPTITFTYEGKETVDYVAHFEEDGMGTVGSYENGETAGKVANDPKNAVTEWTPELFKAGSVDGTHFVDSDNAGTWRAATIDTKNPHSGKYSLKFYGMWGQVGRKFTGLTPNTNYIVTFYANAILENSTKTYARIDNVTVTDANYSVFKKNDEGEIVPISNEDEGWLAKITSPTNVLGVWKKFTIEFNSKDSTEVIVWADSSSDGANLYLDNYAIAHQAIDYTPKVNDKTLGSVTTVKARPGTKTTVKAMAYGEAIFDGWYNGEVLLSKDEKYTFIYSDEAVNYEARFIGSGIGIDGTFENGYTNGQMLAQAIHTKVVNAADTDWNPELWKQTTLDGNNEYFIESNNGGTFRQASVSNAYAYSGNYSLKFEGLYGFVGRKITGLQKNTDYIFSFYMLVKKEATASINAFIVTDTNTAPVLSTGYNIAMGADGCISKSSTKYGKVDEWVKATYTFNSGDNEDVIVWLNHNATGEIYIDDMAIARTANVTVEGSAYGTTTVPAGAISYNQKVTVTATPYEGNTFEGWYKGEELVSTDAEYTFLAQGATVLTPKFSGTTYEHFAYNGMDGTFENGSIDGVYFKDRQYSSDWCSANVSSNSAYEGNKSLEIDGRHRNTIIPLTNLDKNTDYNLSFYFFLNEYEAPAADGSGIIKRANVAAGITTADTESLAEGNLIVDTLYINSEQKWQKVEFTFNSGDNTELNLILRISNEVAENLTFVDNFNLMHGDYVAPEISAGDINGDSDVALDDVNALSQYLAGWNVEVNKDALDVNGDGAVNLKDLVLLAQFVAGWEVTLK